MTIRRASPALACRCTAAAPTPPSLRLAAGSARGRSTSAACTCGQGEGGRGTRHASVPAPLGTRLVVAPTRALLWRSCGGVCRRERASQPLPWLDARRSLWPRLRSPRRRRAQPRRRRACVGRLGPLRCAHGAAPRTKALATRSGRSRPHHTHLGPPPTAGAQHAAQLPRAAARRHAQLLGAAALSRVPKPCSPHLMPPSPSSPLCALATNAGNAVAHRPGRSNALGKGAVWSFGLQALVELPEVVWLGWAAIEAYLWHQRSCPFVRTIWRRARGIRRAADAAGAQPEAADTRGLVRH